MKKKSEINYIVDVDREIYEFDSEKDILDFISATRDMLIEQEMRNMIYCLEKIEIVKTRTGIFKMYMMVKDSYETEKEVRDAIGEYRQAGFNAYTLP